MHIYFHIFIYTHIFHTSSLFHPGCDDDPSSEGTLLDQPEFFPAVSASKTPPGPCRFEPSFRIAAAVLSSKILGPVLAFTGSSLGFMPSEVSYMQPGTWRMSQDRIWTALAVGYMPNPIPLILSMIFNTSRLDLQNELII